jgi:hypothetical protein
VLARLSPAWLWLLVALQLAIPASYYLGRDDPDDERFAWRMFSVVRLKRCEVSASESDASGLRRPIEISSSLHASWVRSLERGRGSVIEHFLALRCAQRGVAASALERRCASASGHPLPSAIYHYDCASHALEVMP